MADRKTAGLTALALLFAPAAAAAEEERGDMFIRGTVEAAPAHAALVAEADRLAIKIYSPGPGVERDPKYRYFREFSLPMTFSVSPPIDMNGNARWPLWRVEAFTDRDGDVLSLVEGELFAETPESLPLGSRGVVLKLAPPRDDDGGG